MFVDGTAIVEDDNNELLKTYTSVADELFTEVNFLRASKSIMSGIKQLMLPATDEAIVLVVKDSAYKFFRPGKIFLI